MTILIIIFMATIIITFCRNWDKFGTIRANFDLMVACLIVFWAVVFAQLRYIHNKTDCINARLGFLDCHLNILKFKTEIENNKKKSKNFDFLNIFSLFYLFKRYVKLRLFWVS